MFEKRKKEEDRVRSADAAGGDQAGETEGGEIG